MRQVNEIYKELEFTIYINETVKECKIITILKKDKIFLI